jgi:CubicO group peptidase (beta-lactamase class C family)
MKSVGAQTTSSNTTCLVLTLFLLLWVRGTATGQMPNTPGTDEATNSATQLNQKLDDYMSRLEGLGFSGVVLAAKDGKVFLEKGYGFADRAQGIRNSKDTALPVGSITKQFTAAAILKLEMAGKLKTTDLMSKYLPNVPSDKAKITLHQLLTHSSGFVESLGPDREHISRSAYVERAMKSDLSFTPGESYGYSNVGYSLLGVIVETVSGKNWEQYLHDELFIPSGMLQTGCVIPHWRPGQLAHGYQNGKDQGTFLEDFDHDGPFWNQRGNGGIISTVGDMYKWHLALLGEEILSKEAKEKLYTPYVREGPEAPTYYGYGWVIAKTSRGTKLIMHNGGNGVFMADFMRLLDDNVVLYAASNSALFPAWEATPRLARLIFGARVVLPPKVINLPSAELESYAGTYKIDSGSQLTLRVREDHLEVAASGQKAFTWVDPAAAGRQKEFLELNARTEQIMNEAHRGNLDPLLEASDLEGPKEEVRKREADAQKRRDEELGPFKTLSVLGTLTGPEERAITIVQEEHERGTAYLRFVRGPRGVIIGMAIDQDPPRIPYYPESERTLVSFDLASGKTGRITAVVAADRKITGLKLEGSQNEDVASRVK